MCTKKSFLNGCHVTHNFNSSFVFCPWDEYIVARIIVLGQSCHLPALNTPFSVCLVMANYSLQIELIVVYLYDEDYKDEEFACHVSGYEPVKDVCPEHGDLITVDDAPAVILGWGGKFFCFFMLPLLTLMLLQFTRSNILLSMAYRK